MKIHSDNVCWKSIKICVFNICSKNIDYSTTRGGIQLLHHYFLERKRSYLSLLSLELAWSKGVAFFWLEASLIVQAIGAYWDEHDMACFVVVRITWTKWNKIVRLHNNWAWKSNRISGAEQNLWKGSHTTTTYFYRAGMQVMEYIWRAIRRIISLQHAVVSSY